MGQHTGDYSIENKNIGRGKWTIPKIKILALTLSKLLKHSESSFCTREKDTFCMGTSDD